MAGRMKRLFTLLLCLTALAFAAGAEQTEPAAAEAANPSPAVADRSQMTTVEEVVEEGMTPISVSALKDGSYEVTVESSSSMFRIDSCALLVENGSMSAVMTMGGKGYLYVYPGTAEEAAAAEESERIPFVETTDGTHSFTIPVPALDAGVPCAAFSKNKELWYDRTLLFRADSLPPEAFRDGFLTTPESLDLKDGEYLVCVTLSGGSGKASVASPARLTVSGGSCTAEIVFSSKNYDYVRIGEEKYLPVNTEGNSTFLIPVLLFDRPMAIIADTVAMSEPHEIAYTLRFASETLEVLS